MGEDGSTSTSLLHRALAREPDAWGRIVNLYSPLVRHWCRQAGVGDQDIPDVSQDAFAADSIELGSFRTDRPGTRFASEYVVRRGTSSQEHMRHRGEPAIGGTTARKRIEQVAARSDGVELSESPDDLASLCQRRWAWCGMNSRTGRGRVLAGDGRRAYDRRCCRRDGHHPERDSPGEVSCPSTAEGRNGRSDCLSPRTAQSSRFRVRRGNNPVTRPPIVS